MQLVESDFIGGRYNPFSAYLLQTHPYLTQGMLHPYNLTQLHYQLDPSWASPPMGTSVALFVLGPEMLQCIFRGYFTQLYLQGRRSP